MPLPLNKKAHCLFPKLWRDAEATGFRDVIQALYLHTCLTFHQLDWGGGERPDLDGSTRHTSSAYTFWKPCLKYSTGDLIR
ncbi:hypothetical protein PgNI_05308, partial [Pyricularia grisea]|uniref:Uncharacterized protein n=1 Tax=Pyricularia grisea TaxID=148305 RepID=A0A6P8B3R0_PYRGI